MTTGLDASKVKGVIVLRPFPGKNIPPFIDGSSYAALVLPFKRWYILSWKSPYLFSKPYLLGVVTGRTDWQKYLELIGPGGTHKGRFFTIKKN